MTTGVPNGFILGPLLFIIDIRDIRETSKNFKAILLAQAIIFIHRIYKFTIVTKVTNSSYNVHTDPLFKKLNLLRVKYISRPSVMQLYYTFRKENLSFYMMNMFMCTNAGPVHEYSLIRNLIWKT